MIRYSLLMFPAMTHYVFLPTMLMHNRAFYNMTDVFIYDLFYCVRQYALKMP